MTTTETMLEAIRRAVEADADAESKQLGVQACRALLAVLDAKPGEPLAETPQPTTPLAAAAAQIQNAPPDLVMEGIIAKLRQYLPEGPNPTQPRPPGVRIPFVVLPAKSGSDE